MFWPVYLCQVTERRKTRDRGCSNQIWQAFGSVTKLARRFQMSKDTMAATVDHHSHTVGGVLYRFRLRWAALEPRWSSRSARYLLEIEARPEAGGQCTIVHVMTLAATSRANLVRLVDAALEEQLGGERLVGATA